MIEKVLEMDIKRHATTTDLGRAAAEEGAAHMRAAISRDGAAAIVVATGASQFSVLTHLVTQPDIDWSKVTAFHLDEYVGLPVDHPASFRRYLQERFVDRLPDLKAFVAVDGTAPDMAAELTRLADRIRERRVCVCFAGIGENCHLAFNDPPADFDTEQPYIIVSLDEACRRQQMGEGWFTDLGEVPKQAISMSIRQIMDSERLILSVPDARKAQAVHDAVEGPVSPKHPASIAQTHPACTLHLDAASAAELADTV